MKAMSKKIVGLVGAVAVVAAVSGYALRAARADIPDTEVLRYAGQLEDGNGTPLTGVQNITLTVFDAASAGNSLCTTNKADVICDSQGRFEMALSDQCVGAIHAKGNTWLEVSVGAESLGRTKLGAVPYAVEAGRASEAAGPLLATVNAAATKDSVPVVTGWTTSPIDLTYSVDSSTVPGQTSQCTWRRVGDAIEAKCTTHFSSTPPDHPGLLTWAIPMGYQLDLATWSASSFGLSVGTDPAVTKVCSFYASTPTTIAAACPGYTGGITIKSPFPHENGTGFQFAFTAKVVSWKTTP